MNPIKGEFVFPFLFLLEKHRDLVRIWVNKHNSVVDSLE